MIGLKEIDFFSSHLKKLSKKEGVSFDFQAWKSVNNQISFEKKKLKNYSSSKDKNLTLRLSTHNKSGVSYTKNFSKEGLEECYKQALNSLNLSDKKEKGELSLNQTYKDMSREVYNPNLSSINLSEKIEQVKRMDQAALSLGSKIQPLSNVGVDQEFSILFGNSESTQGFYRSNHVFAYSHSLAIDDKYRSQGMSQQSSRDYQKIDFQKLGEESASKSLKKLNFSIPKTNSYPVVFQSGQASSTLVSLLLSHLNGKDIYDNVSLLEKSLNQKKLSSVFSLYDDPFAFWGVRSAPFDGEGFASQKTTLVEKGVVQNYLTNSFFAQALKSPHTAKASRASNGTVAVAPTNIVMQEGTDSFSDLLKGHSELIVVDFLKGLAGYNPISGDFSIESEGFLWRRGESQALCQFTVAGNIIDVFSDLSKVAKDSACYNGLFKVPSFLIPSLSVAGK